MTEGMDTKIDVMAKMSQKKIQNHLRAFSIGAFLVPFLILLFAINLEAKVRIPSLCKIHHPSDTRIEWECVRIKKGQTLEGLFGDRWQDVARYNRIDRRHAYPGIVIKVPKNLDEIKDFTPMPEFYPPAQNEAKFILLDLSEQFLGAYEYGKLIFSFPAAVGRKGHETPTGDFRITAYHSRNKSSLYFIEGTTIPYPMHYSLRFYISPWGVRYWIHGRDMPGYPASHGCIGLYDEAMQRKYYRFPKYPVLQDSKKLFDWVISPRIDDRRLHILKDGPRIRIIGRAPDVS